MKKLLATILIAATLVCMIPTMMLGVFAAGDDELTPDTSWYTDEAYAKNGNKYLLEDAADVLGFSNLLAGIDVSAPVNFEGKNVELTADVNLQNKTWGLLSGAINDDATRPESRDPWEFAVLQNYGFWGNFNGNGHTIQNFQFDAYESDANDAHDCCLFGIVPKGKTASVKNLLIDFATIELSYFSGAIFSTIEGTASIDSVYIGNNVTVRASGQSIGMLVGRVMPTGDLTVTNSVLEGTFVDSWTKDRLHAAFVASIAGKVSIENSALYGTMTKTGSSNLQTSSHAGIVQKFEKAPSVSDANYSPNLTLKNIIVCAMIADSHADGQSLGKVTYLMKEPSNDVKLNMENVLYVQTSYPILGVEGTLVEVTDLIGSASSGLLTEKGFTAWSATSWYPLPTTLKEIVYPETIDTSAADVETTDAPTTDAPTTDAPTTDAPTTDAPATDAPTTDAPATDAPTTDAVNGGGCGGFAIVSPLVALICAAAVVLIVKKK